MDETRNATESEQLITLGRTALERLLPHRGNALLIDTVDIFKSGHLGFGYLDLAAEHHSQHVFVGHFPPPRSPVMPGHWLIEFASLTCAALFTVSSGTPITDTTGMRIVGLDGCRFHSEVLPGMILCCTATLMKQKKGFVIFSADITRIVDGESVRVCQINRLTGAIVQG